MDMINSEIIGKQIRRLRKERRISQEKMAEDLGMYQADISNLERAASGSGISDLFKLDIIADYFGVPLVDILLKLNTYHFPDPSFRLKKKIGRSNAPNQNQRNANSPKNSPTFPFMLEQQSEGIHTPKRRIGNPIQTILAMRALFRTKTLPAMSMPTISKRIHHSFIKLRILSPNDAFIPLCTIPYCLY